MGDGKQLPVRDLEQTGPLPPALLHTLSTRNAAHCHLVWTVRTREESTVLTLRWEKTPKKTKKATAPAKKGIGPAVPVGPNNALHKPATHNKSQVTETPATRTRRVTKQPTALFRATNQSGKCERELPAHTTAEVLVAPAVAGPKRRRKTPCRIRHDLERWRRWRSRIAEKGRQRELPAVSPTLASTVPEAEPPATGTSLPPPEPLLPADDLPSSPAKQETDDELREAPPSGKRKCALYKHTTVSREEDMQRCIYALHLPGSKIVAIRDHQTVISSGATLKDGTSVTQTFENHVKKGITNPNHLATENPDPWDYYHSKYMWTVIANSEYSLVLADYVL